MTAYSTKIFTTQTGVKVRIDTEFCGMNRADGTKCNLFGKRCYYEYKDPQGKVRRTWYWVCEHQRFDLNNGPIKRVFWNEDMLTTMHDKIHSGKIFKKINDELKAEFPGEPWDDAEVIKPETRPGKGKYKEYDCAAKKKYEDSKLKDVLGDVWKDSVLRKEANQLKSNTKDYEPFRNKMQSESRQSQKTLLEDCKECGHENFVHDQYSNKCSVCGKYCEVETNGSERTE